MRVLPASVLAFTALTLFRPAAARSQSGAMMDTTGWGAATPLTGRALPCEGGQIKAFATMRCENVELLAFLPRSMLANSTGYDVWGWHDSTTKREFVLIGGDSTAFVEVTDPLNPKYLGVLPPHASGTAQSVKVYKHYALIGYEASENGIQVFDLAELRNVKSPPVVFKETAHYDGITNTHTITVNQATGFAYINGTNTCGGGLHMLDVRTPTKPTPAGCYTEEGTGRAGTGYVHDAQCVIYRGPDKQYTGREICVNYAETGISIADVTDKQQPKTLSIVTYPNVAYTHQGWFTEDQRYIFVDDELDEFSLAQQNGWDTVRTRTIGFDLNDLDDPVVLVEYYNPKSHSADHNLYIRGHYMYQGNYGAGFRAIDVADPKNPKEVGSLANIGAAWGTYPYFKDDVVAVSASTGLFLVRLQTR